MIPLYFVTSHEPDPEWASWLGHRLHWSMGVDNPHNLLCYFDSKLAQETVDFLAAHKSYTWVGPLRIRKVMGTVYPSNVEDSDHLCRPVSDKVFVHGDHGPYTYYVIREGGDGYFLGGSKIGHRYSTVELDCSRATAYRTADRAFGILERMKKYPQEDIYLKGNRLGSGVSVDLIGTNSDFRWRVEKRQGFFVPKDTSPRLRTLLAGKDRWTLDSILVEPVF